MDFTIDENPVLFRGRTVIKLKFPCGKIQPMYLSSGRHSKQPNTWFPFDGGDVFRFWFDKERYCQTLELKRFGSLRLKEISDYLSLLDVSKAKEVSSLEEVNEYLFSSPTIDTSKLANLLDSK